MNESLTTEELQRCSLIIRRGCYFYNKLNEEYSQGFNYQDDSISVIAHYIRSLAEITVGMRLWFSNEENIKALNSATFIDCNHFICKTKQKKNNYRQLYYPDGGVTISEYRKKDDIYTDTLALTSKLVHQDEFSILGFSETSEFKSTYISLGDRLTYIAGFWLDDFKNAICILNNNIPNIIEYYKTNMSEIPFEYNTISFKPNQTSS